MLYIVHEGHWLSMKALVLLVMLPVIAADITSTPYPPELKTCLESEGNADASLYTGESVASTCISRYAWDNKAKIHPHVPSKAEKDYIGEMSTNPKHERVRRGTFPRGGKPRQRKEYRLLSRKARDRYHTCMNLLKNTPIPNGTISRYDAIALMHNSEVAGSAHGGVNFLSWHRVYLYTLENALRSVARQCRKVTLPYWDCTAEYYSDQIRRGDSANSIIFSDEFAGNADGAVNTGAFREWNLVRNIGFAWSLFGRDEIDDMLTRTNHGQITVPFAQRRYNLEFYHNSIHVFLGGFLLDISLAPRDPLFFLLHAYVDFIWELFRQSMISRGLDPEIYPPFDNNQRHAPDRPMEGFPDWTNSEGYLNDWNDKIAQYKPTFNCDRNKNCRRGPRRSRWIGCQSLPNFGRQCVSLPRNDMQDSTRKRRATGGTEKSPYTRIQMCDKNTCPYKESGIQNTYAVNDKVDSSLWVYIPVKVVYERSAGLVFNAYDMFTKNNIMDIYDPSRNDKLKRMLFTGNARTYDSCRVSGTGATKVYIRADGISYSGNSMEYAIVDERYPIMVQKAFIPIKDPGNENSEVCLMAYDECGRICLPTCLVKGSEPPVYVPCSGCIRVDSKSPKRYGKTIADVIADHWTFHDVHDDGYMCPEEAHVHVFVKFVCDSSTKFPWQRLGKHG